MTRMEVFSSKYDTKNWTFFGKKKVTEFNLYSSNMTKELAFFSWIWRKELNPLFLEYHAQNWILFSNLPRIEPFFFKIRLKHLNTFGKFDSKNWTLYFWLNSKYWTLYFEYGSKNGTHFFGTQRIVFFSKKNDSKNWTLLKWNMTSRTEFFTITLRIEVLLSMCERSSAKLTCLTTVKGLTVTFFMHALSHSQVQHCGSRWLEADVHRSASDYRQDVWPLCDCGLTLPLSPSPLGAGPLETLTAQRFWLFAPLLPMEPVWGLTIVIAPGGLETEVHQMEQEPMPWFPPWGKVAYKLMLTPPWAPESSMSYSKNPPTRFSEAFELTRPLPWIVQPLETTAHYRTLQRNHWQDLDGIDVGDGSVGVGDGGELRTQTRRMLGKWRHMMSAGCQRVRLTSLPTVPTRANAHSSRDLSDSLDFGQAPFIDNTERDSWSKDDWVRLQLKDSASPVFVVSTVQTASSLASDTVGQVVMSLDQLTSKQSS